MLSSGPTVPIVLRTRRAHAPTPPALVYAYPSFLSYRRIINTPGDARRISPVLARSFALAPLSRRSASRDPPDGVYRLACGIHGNG